MQVTLSGPFPLVDKHLEINDRQWKLTFVEDQDALLEGVETEDDLANFPYGLMLWPSALGLAQRLAEEPALINGKPVLELGAGAGLAGLVAASLGGQVVQTDYLDDALTLCRHNAAQNGIGSNRLTVRKGDWRNFPSDLQGASALPAIIGADILYERSLHPTLLTLLPHLIAPGGWLLVADPIRPQALDFLETWEKRYAWPTRTESRQVRWEGGVKDLALIWVYHPAS